MKRVMFWPHMVNTFKKLRIYAEHYVQRHGYRKML